MLDLLFALLQSIGRASGRSRGFRMWIVVKGHQPGFGIAGVAQLVEHNVANVVVVGSNPITRFFLGEALFYFLLAVEK